MPELTPILNTADNKRKLIHKKVLEGIQESFPVNSRNKFLEVSNVKIKIQDFSPTKQKEAILKGDTLSETVTCDVTMKDAKGGTIDKVKNFSIARIPWYTPRGTMIVGGNEYSVANQLRPKPGIYSRKRANGVLETAFNLKGATNFSITMDPEKGVPQLEYGTTKIPLYSILRSLGVPSEKIQAVWGASLADANARHLDRNQQKHLEKLYNKIIPAYARKTEANNEEIVTAILQHYSRGTMSGEVNQSTIGKNHTTVTPDSLLAASNKLLKMYRNVEGTDDRDNLDFKAMHSTEDFFKEIITLNARNIARKTALKMEKDPNIKKVLPSSPFTPGLVQFINSSQLASVPTSINPVELIDASMRVTSLGEGGISSDRAIPEEARHIHTTQINALDPFRTPETFRAGVDVRAAMMAQKDENGNIYVPLRNVKNGKIEYHRTGDTQKHVVAFPNESVKGKGKVEAIKNGVITTVNPNEVEFQMPHPSLMYSPTTNLIPFLESLQGNRAVMGSKMQTQALSLVEREAPYVQVKAPDDHSFEEHMAKIINPCSPVAGTVRKIDKDYVYIEPDSEVKTASKKPLIKIPYETYFPLAAKTYLNHDIAVKPGDHVEANQTLGESNFTRNNTLALGKNLSVAYMPYRGKNSNDAVVISEAAAKKLTSERMYKSVLQKDPDLVFNKNKFVNYYGHSYTKAVLDKLDDAGIAAPGTTILPGEPLVVGLRKSSNSADDVILGRLHRSLVKPYREAVTTWDHAHVGTVVDVVNTPSRITLTVKTQEPMDIGDKLSGRFGNKGVVSDIIPDAQMIQDEEGKPVDVLMTSAGVVSRTNPAVILETAIGKVVEKTGKPILVDNLTGRDNISWAKDLLKKHNIKDKETVFDPITGKHIPKVFVGRQYIHKLMKSTDTNYGARNIGTYDVNQQPTKSGATSAKGLGKMEFDALVGHNARSVIKETAIIKSQKNDEYWKSVQLGYPTPPPKTPFAADKFFNMLNAAGVKTTREGTRMSLAPLTDEDVLGMSSGEIKEPTLVRGKDLTPERGGLFDVAITGGLTGNRWGHIDLAEPVVNPVFNDPVRRLLNMTTTQLEDTLNTKGGDFIKKELAKIDLDKKEKEIKRSMKNKSANDLDNEVKTLKYIQALKKQNLKPEEAYVVSKVPVLPPVFRPVLPGRGKQELMYGDVNPLYRDLAYTNKHFKDIQNTQGLPPSEINRLRPTLQAAVGAVYGTNEPISSKSKARGHKGILNYIAGVTSPKEGYFHKKLMKRTQDVSGRGTIVPDSTLGMDQVGLPEDMLWTMYEKFLIKRLVRRGFPAVEAKRMVESKHPTAKQVLDEEIKERPVIINRAPTLHRYSMIGAFPVPVPGKTIRVNPFVEAGSNADYDGDTMMIHAPVSQEAIEDVKRMTLPNLLYSDKSRNDLLVFPQHEAIMGVAHATSLDDKNKPVNFKTKGAAMKAYRENKIGLGTRFNIGK
jgi:DNA-directed RNA polymerase beta subunit